MTVVAQERDINPVRKENTQNLHVHVLTARGAIACTPRKVPCSWEGEEAVSQVDTNLSRSSVGATMNTANIVALVKSLQSDGTNFWEKTLNLVNSWMRLSNSVI